MEKIRLVERLSGAYWLRDANVELPISLILRWSFRSAYLPLEGVVDLEGELDAEGLVCAAPVSGTLALGLHRGGLRLDYRLGFRGTDGTSLTLEGVKQLHASSFLLSFSLLPAILFEKDHTPLGRALLRFDVIQEVRTFLWPTMRSGFRSPS